MLFDIEVVCYGDAALNNEKNLIALLRMTILGNRLPYPEHFFQFTPPFVIIPYKDGYAKIPGIRITNRDSIQKTILCDCEKIDCENLHVERYDLEIEYNREYYHFKAELEKSLSDSEIHTASLQRRLRQAMEKKRRLRQARIEKFSATREL